MSIDLNADVGEGMDDAALLPYVTSANVACGMHAGDPSVMDGTVSFALSHGVRVGAHPGYPDREHFGRAPVEISAEAVENLVLYQIAALDGFVRSRGGTLTHVKPHGALYHTAAVDVWQATAVVAAIVDYDRSLPLVCLPGSVLASHARDNGLRVVAEGFADRAYLPDGRLMPRTDPRAVVSHVDTVAARAVAMVADGYVEANDGSRVELSVDTLCVHGDTPGAVEIARKVRAALTDAGIAVQSFVELR